jgi:glycosyltransferase involved in cell wall biosynthesis
MRVLVISQLFSPEMGALPNRLYPLTRHLAAQGHDVFVATGMPNYPTGKVFPDYKGQRFMRERIDGVTVLRTASYTVPRNVSKPAQLLSYASFLPAVLHSGWRAGDIDVVFVTSPPIFPALPAILLAKLRRAKLVVDLRDLWPDEVLAVGAAREGSPSIRLLRLIERWVYREADIVTCTTEAFLDTVAERGVNDKGRLLPNGADVELFRPLPRENEIAAEYPFGERFVVMYSGLLGIKHGLETLIDAAAILRDRTDIVFFIRGEGPRREALLQHAEQLGLDNVLFGGERQIEDLPYLLARADVCVTNLLPDPYFDKIISVKVFEYLACGKPVVGALGGEGARVLERSGGGITVDPAEAAAMADAILELYDSPERRAALGEAGRRHVEENYSRAAIAVRLEGMLTELVASPS